jgi:hypothetical protein
VQRRLEPDTLGALIVAHWQGSLMLWSFAPDTGVVEFVRAALDDLLARLNPADPAESIS